MPNGHRGTVRRVAHCVDVALKGADTPDRAIGRDDLQDPTLIANGECAAIWRPGHRPGRASARLQDADLCPVGSPDLVVAGTGDEHRPVGRPREIEELATSTLRPESAIETAVPAPQPDDARQGGQAGRGWSWEVDGSGSQHGAVRRPCKAEDRVRTRQYSDQLPVTVPEPYVPGARGACKD